jgi:pilus assembly protein CpaB
MARPSEQAETVQIVVAKREIQKGEPFRPDDIRLMDWPKETVPEGAIDSVEKLVEKRSRGMIYPGEPIIDKKLIGKGDMTSLSTEFPPGMKGISVKVDNESGIAGMILPGDNVDVLVYVEANPSKQIFATETVPIEENMKVMAVDDQLHRPDGKETSISAKTVTLLATPKQAGRITHACEIGKVRLVLRSGKDGAEETTGPYTTSTQHLLSGKTSSGDESKSSENKIVDLPSTKDEGPSFGEQFQGGINDLRALMDEIKTARDGSEKKEQPHIVVLIEGNETREIQFDSAGSAGRKGPGLAHLKGGGSPAPAAGGSSPDADPPVEDLQPSPEQMETMEKLFNPKAQREGSKAGKVSLAQ